MDMTARDVAWLEAAAEEYRVERSLTAQRDAHRLAADALDSFMAGDMGEAFTRLHNAQRAADEAFPPGSPDAEAFALLAAGIADGAYREES